MADDFEPTVDLDLDTGGLPAKVYLRVDGRVVRIWDINTAVDGRQLHLNLPAVVIGAKDVRFDFMTAHGGKFIFYGVSGGPEIKSISLSFEKESDGKNCFNQQKEAESAGH